MAERTSKSGVLLDTIVFNELNSKKPEEEISSDVVPLKEGRSSDGRLNDLVLSLKVEELANLPHVLREQPGKTEAISNWNLGIPRMNLPIMIQRVHAPQKGCPRG